MVVVDYAQCSAMLARIKRPKARSKTIREYYTGTLETFMSLGLGSGANGETITQIPCGNLPSAGRGATTKVCPNFGVLACSKCFLVKYCSNHCQRLHWPKHRVDCENSLLDGSWEPGWIEEGREPIFKESNQNMRYRPTHSVFPAADCLQLSYNEQDASTRDFKLCFSAAGDIRNVIKTVNGLPKDYKGQCDILLNDTDAVVVNRNLVILYALLSAGPSIEESAELATHLMYSAALPAASAAYVRGCIRIIYRDGASDGDMSFQSSLKTRGAGKIHSLQTTMAMKRPMEMFLSTYDLRKGLESMRSIVISPQHKDNRDRYYGQLEPAHRLALTHYWESGILVPFSLDTRGFSQPNRLLFSVDGEWLGRAGSNPLHGWDVTSAQESGSKYGIDSADIFGCLFFHIKRELMEFARRMKEFHIDIYLTQFDPQVLSKGISTGVLPAFEGACFDRVETSNMADYGGILEALINWGSLLNKDNEHACLLFHSTNWHHSRPNAIAQSNPRTAEILIERCNKLTLESRLRNVLAQGAKSPAVIHLIESLDAFVDHEDAFRGYLREQHVEDSAKHLGLRLRTYNRVYPKRFGVPLVSPKQKLPDLSRDEFYNLFTLGGAGLPVRFVEFEVVSSSDM